MKSRRACREYAVQGLYQCDIVRDMRHEKVEAFLNHLIAYPDFAVCDGDEDGSESDLVSTPVSNSIHVSDYCRTLLYGVIDNLEVIDATLASSSTNWSIGRMAAVDRCILRIATYELLFCADVPAKVVINEAVEISKDFSGEEAYLFINGVLDKVREVIQQPHS